MESIKVFQFTQFYRCLSYQLSVKILLKREKFNVKMKIQIFNLRKLQCKLPCKAMASPEKAVLLHPRHSGRLNYRHKSGP